VSSLPTLPPSRADPDTLIIGCVLSGLSDCWPTAGWAGTKHSTPVATKMVLQLARQDIGQLTDVGLLLVMLMTLAMLLSVLCSGSAEGRPRRRRGYTGCRMIAMPRQIGSASVGPGWPGLPGLLLMRWPGLPGLLLMRGESWCPGAWWCAGPPAIPGKFVASGKFGCTMIPPILPNARILPDNLPWYRTGERTGTGGANEVCAQG
jgi:hypothetical protein